MISSRYIVNMAYIAYDMTYYVHTYTLHYTYYTLHTLIPSNLPLLCVVATKLDLLSPLSVLNTDKPKSASLTSGGLSLLSKMFSGLMSECMIPVYCVVYDMSINMNIRYKSTNYCKHINSNYIIYTKYSL